MWECFASGCNECRLYCKTKTDMKEDFDKVASRCDQSIVINTDCTKLVVSYK